MPRPSYCGNVDTYLFHHERGADHKRTHRTGSHAPILNGVTAVFIRRRHHSANHRQSAALADASRAHIITATFATSPSMSASRDAREYA